MKHNVLSIIDLIDTGIQENLFTSVETAEHIKWLIMANYTWDDYWVHNDYVPWRTIESLLWYKQISRKDVEIITWIKEDRLNKLISWEIMYTDEDIVQFEKLFFVWADFWNHLKSNYYVTLWE